MYIAKIVFEIQNFKIMISENVDFKWQLLTLGDVYMP